jgi:hypothetical protein
VFRLEIDAIGMLILDLREANERGRKRRQTTLVADQGENV